MVKIFLLLVCFILQSFFLPARCEYYITQFKDKINTIKYLKYSSLQEEEINTVKKIIELLGRYNQYKYKILYH